MILSDENQLKMDDVLLQLRLQTLKSSIWYKASIEKVFVRNKKVVDVEYGQFLGLARSTIPFSQSITPPRSGELRPRRHLTFFPRQLR